MNTYLINLDRSPERLAFMRDQLVAMNIDFTRIPAIDARKLTPCERKKGFSKIRSFIAARKRLSDAEVAVALSHIECCKKIANSTAPCALILEDDVILEEGFAKTLKRVEAFIDPNRAQCVLLSGYGVPNAQSLPEEIRRVPSAWCADAYVLTKPAAKLILRANSPVITVADSFKRWRKRFDLELYRAFPSTARQDDETFASENLVLPKSPALVRAFTAVLDYILWRLTGK